jgi:hypothetical protein
MVLRRCVAFVSLYTVGCCTLLHVAYPSVDKVYLVVNKA